MSTKKRNKRVESESLSYEQVLALHNRIKAGDKKARDTLLLGHLWLVQHLIPGFLHRGVPYEDLYQEGCLGLSEAIDRYDTERGLKFSTCAATYIKKYLYDAVRRQSDRNPLTVGEHFYYRYQRYQHAISSLTGKLGRPPTGNEIAEEARLDPQEVKMMGQYSYRFVSLDTPTVCGYNASSPSPEEEYFRRNYELDLSVFPDVRLTVLEKKILSFRYGFTPDGNPRSCESIAQELGIATTTVRLHLKKALDKLRESKNTKPQKRETEKT